MWWYDKLLDFQIDNAAIYDQALSDPWTQLVLAKLLDNRIVANRCDYRRLHTLLTQLAREARRYLSAKNGERLAIVDVSACQPLIIGLLASSPPNDPTRPRHTTTTICRRLSQFCGPQKMDRTMRVEGYLQLSLARDPILPWVH
jgi:hypothetical protein